MVSLCDVSTDFDTQVSVFTGSCTSLECVGGNDESDAKECGFTSEFQWQSEAFRTYMIAVHGFENATGSFSIFVLDMGGIPAFDTCEAAGGPVPLDFETVVTLSGGAVIDDRLLLCEQASNLLSSRPGIWLYLNGDGGNITLSACEDSPSTSVKVFSGTDCQSLACIGTSNNSCSMTFTSNIDERYYVFCGF
jgi:hypothetical protein